MIKKYIKRKHCLKDIIPFIDKDLIKVIVGQRRVGKSYLLYQIMDVLKDRGVKTENIIYISKELHDFEYIKTHKDLLAYVKEKSRKADKYYIFIDEIQEVDKFEKALESLQASGGYDIYCTGSNANLLSSELATYISGRYVEIKVYSLSYPEFLYFHKLDDNRDAFLKYIRYGGMPFLINLALTDEVVYEYLRNIYSAILFKDIVKKHSIRNTAFLERLVEYLSDNTGCLVSAKSISDFLKSQKINLSPNIVLNYLSFLSNAFFVFKVQRSDVYGKKIFEIGEKYYFEDLGLRHSITGYKHTDINKILENLVFLCLRINGYKVTAGKLRDKEIDFVCDKGEKRIYVQVAYMIDSQKTIDREFGNLLKIEDNYPKFVVSMDETAAGKYKGIEQINIREFLKLTI